MSDSGHTISVGTIEGDIILLKKQNQLEGKEAETLVQGNINEYVAPLKQSSKKEVIKKLFTKLPGKLKYTSSVSVNDISKQQSESNSELRFTKTAKWSSTVLRGHKDSVNVIVVSSDDSWIVSSSDDSTVQIWDEKNVSVRSVSIAADGMFIVSDSWDKTVRIWEPESEKWKSTALHGHENAVQAVVITPDGKRIVSGSSDNIVRVWAVENDEWRSTALRGHDGSVTSVAITSDGIRIVSGSNVNTVRV